MLQITPHMRVLLAVSPVDFRKGMDGLARLCLDTLEHDPFSGTVFVFRNRRRTAIKVLLYVLPSDHGLENFSKILTIRSSPPKRALNHYRHNSVQNATTIRPVTPKPR